MHIIFFQLERLITKNYFLNLSAKEAFKAYVRAYESHSLKQIFDVQTLDLVAVGRSFGFTVPPHIDLGVGISKKAIKARKRDEYNKGNQKKFIYKQGKHNIKKGNFSR